MAQGRALERLGRPAEAAAECARQLRVFPAPDAEARPIAAVARAR